MIKVDYSVVIEGGIYLQVREYHCDYYADDDDDDQFFKSLITS